MIVLCIFYILHKWHSILLLASLQPPPLHICFFRPIFVDSCTSFTHCWFILLLLWVCWIFFVAYLLWIKVLQLKLFFSNLCFDVALDRLIKGWKILIYWKLGHHFFVQQWKIIIVHNKIEKLFVLNMISKGLNEICIQINRKNINTK